MKDEILEHIRKHVTEWPKGAESVWLDAYGEIRFDRGDFDFCPNEAFNPSGVSEFYTREQWQQQNLETLDKPFGKLDRKTQLRLVEHVLDGGSVERSDPLLNTSSWIYQKGARESKLLCFVDRLKYRAKPSRKDEIARQIKKLQDELDKIKCNHE